MYAVKEGTNRRRPEELRDSELFQRGLKDWLDTEQVSDFYQEFKDDLKSVTGLTLEELQKLGMSNKDAFKFSSLMELFKRSEEDGKNYKEQIMSSQQMARRLMRDLGDKRQETRAFSSLLPRYPMPYHSRENGIYRRGKAFYC